MVPGSDRALITSSDQFYWSISFVWTDYLSINLSLPDHHAHPVLTLPITPCALPSLIKTLELWQPFTTVVITSGTYSSLHC